MRAGSYFEAACLGRREVQWVLIDGMQGGSGVALDWARLAPPVGCGTRGWVLAGGLTPENVQEVPYATPLLLSYSAGSWYSSNSSYELMLGDCRPWVYPCQLWWTFRVGCVGLMV